MIVPLRLVLILGIFLLICLGIYAFMARPSGLALTNEDFDPAKLLQSVDTSGSLSTFIQIENLAVDVTRKYGVAAGFELINEGQREHLISNDDCHEYLHYVGHEAYAQHPGDFQTLLDLAGENKCIGGYLHGIEAEIVIESPNMIQEVSDFCIFQKEHNVNPGPCFHGVGHSAEELYDYDTQKALDLCDALAGGPENDLTNCYRGAFSQIGNVVIGSDGHTGLPADRKQIPGLDEKDPYAFCDTFAEKYQSSCKSQLLKILLMDVDTDDWLDICMRPDFAESSKKICVNMIAGIYIRSGLSFAPSATLPERVNDLPQELRRISMLGGLEGYMGYFTDGNPKDWNVFCDAYTDASDREYCASIFHRAIDKNEAPWMERSDIR